MSLLCFAGEQGHFPEAEKDPVIQIASLVTEQGQSKPLVRNVMTLDTCAAIVGTEVMSFDKEEDLLKACAKLLPVVSHFAMYLDLVPSPW